MADKIELHGWTDLIIDANALNALTSAAFKLYSYYVLRARDKGSAFPGLPRIADDLTLEGESWSESKVKRYNTELTEKHYIFRQRRMSSSSITHVFKTPDLCLKFLSQFTDELSDQVTGEPKKRSSVSRITGHQQPDIKRTKKKKNEGEDSAGKPAAPKKESKAQLDAKGVPINIHHPQWEGMWKAVVALKPVVTDAERGNAAKVVREIIKPCAFEPADVLAFALWAKEKEWNDWTVNAIPTRISEVRQWRLSRLQQSQTSGNTLDDRNTIKPMTEEQRQAQLRQMEEFEKKKRGGQ